MTDNNIQHTEFCNKKDNIHVTGLALRNKIRGIMSMLNFEQGNILCSLNIDLQLVLCKIDNLLDKAIIKYKES